MKSGFIGIIGRPNVGKSTLLNAMVGEKVAITTDKPQTTRNSIRGIYTRMPDGEDEGCQMVFIDTPGVHKGRNKLGQAMTEMAANTLNEVDAVIFIVDSYSEKGGDKYVFDMVKECEAPKILVINKIDSIKREDIPRSIEYYSKETGFDEIVPVSATDGTNVDELIRCIFKFLPALL